MKVQRQQTQRGFTIVELIITVGILAVLTAFALPTMVKVKRKTEHSSAVSTVVEALQTARSQAVIDKRTRSPAIPTIKDMTISPTDINVEYDFMGRAKFDKSTTVTERCVTITHSKDANIVSSVLIRQVGNPDVFKHKTTCQ